MVASIFIISIHIAKPWKGNIIGGGDTWGYYMYLPAIFIYQDLPTLEKSTKTRFSYNSGYSIDKTPKPQGEAQLAPNGNYVIKYTVGMAILYSPFFFLAHGLASMGISTPDGYSYIYIYIVHLSSIFYVVWALLLISKILRHYVDDKTAALTVLGIGLGTNLFYFVVLNSAMSHPYLLFLYTALIYQTQQWYLHKNRKNALLIGICAGLITLIRPTEIISIFIPILWGISSLKDFRARFGLIREHLLSYSFSVLMFILMGIPQLIYWKYVSGDFLYYSYTTEAFHFRHPEFIRGIFGYQNGWLAYTPIMYFALLGIPIAFKKKNQVFTAILGFLPIHIYITYSWWCWYYINGFGSRPMVETYALLAIPMGLTLQFILKKQWLTFLGLTIFGLLIVLNLFQTYQFKKGLLWSENANWAYYKRTFGRTSINYLDLATYDSGINQPNEDLLQFQRLLHHNTFKDSIQSNNYVPNPEKGTVLKLGPNNTFSPEFIIPLKDLDLKTNEWLRVSATCMRQYDGNDIYRMSTIVVTTDAPVSFWYPLRLDNKTGNDSGNLWGGKSNIWTEAYYWVRIPKNTPKNKMIKFLVWNPTQNPIFIQDIKVEVWGQN